jgi:hypothetical protein
LVVLAENRLFLTENYTLAWLARPVILLILITANAFYPVIMKAQEGNWSRSSAPEAAAARRLQREGMTWEKSLFLRDLAPRALWIGRKFTQTAFPWAIGFPILALSVAHLISSLREEATVETKPQSRTGPEIPSRTAGRRNGWIGGCRYLALGFNIAGPLFFCPVKIREPKDGSSPSLFSAISWLLIYGLFDRVLRSFSNS